MQGFQKWNSDFLRDTSNWQEKDCFEAWFARFWRIAKRNNVDDPTFFKDTLYDKIYDATGKHLGELITPENN